MSNPLLANFEVNESPNLDDVADAHMNDWGYEPPTEDVAPDATKSKPIGPNILDADYPSAPPKKPRNTKRLQSVQSMYAMAGMGVFQFDPELGQVIMQQAPDCAEALDKLAKENATVARVLDGAMQTSAWSAVIFAHLPIAVMAATKYIPYLRDNYNETYRQATEHE